MRVRHDAKIEVTTIWPAAFGSTKDKTIMTPAQLEGHKLVMGAMFNVSGYYNPDQPKLKIKVLEGILTGEELCDCKEFCVP